MSAATDPTGIESAVEDGVVHGLVDLDVITVVGGDTEEYLQGQLSQNVGALAVGETRWSLLLQPQGKVEAWMRVYRPDTDRLWLLVDAGFGDGALARLERFKLRVDVTLRLDRRIAVALRGPDSGRVAETAGAPGDHLPVVADWGPIAGVDLVPDDGAAPFNPEPDGRYGPAADAGAMELVRILQGRPLMGRELDASTIPAAAGVVAASVDFTKGCYVGQELVARIDSRGSNTPTRLVRVAGSEGSLPAVGAALHVDGADGGTLTSAALSPGHGLVGLAYVKRAVEVPGAAQIESEDGEPITVRLEPLAATPPSTTG